MLIILIIIFAVFLVKGATKIEEEIMEERIMDEEPMDKNGKAGEK